MKVFELKEELEKIAKVVPELRQELDEAYSSDKGKKTKIKMLWKQYEAKHKELRESREYKNLDLH
ncbi:MAG TPA: hypothetical protein VNJ08_04800 [Bacteriovoracaceae bacterium]|nr:hypothetical protein [Bacteriovoracaceae bacterium]